MLERADTRWKLHIKALWVGSALRRSFTAIATEAEMGTVAALVRLLLLFHDLL